MDKAQENIMEFKRRAKERFPWATVARIDEEQGRRDLFIYQCEPRLAESLYGETTWVVDSGRQECLAPFWVFSWMLGLDNVNPATWELRLD